MASYTMELRKVVEQVTIPELFNFPMPMWSGTAADMEQLETDFVSYYYFHEIGYETIEQFRQRLQVYWNMRLEKFDKVFKAYAQDIEPLLTYSGNSELKRTDMDTPQSKLNPDTDYASFISINNSNTSGYAGRSPISLINEYAELVRETRREFFESMEVLFMGVYRREKVWPWQLKTL